MDIGRAAFQEGGQVQQLRRSVNSFERKQAFRVSGDVLTKSVLSRQCHRLSIHIELSPVWHQRLWCFLHRSGWTCYHLEISEKKALFSPNKGVTIKRFHHQPGSNKVCPNKTKKTHKMCKKRLQLWSNKETDLQLGWDEPQVLQTPLSFLAFWLQRLCCWTNQLDLKVL